MTQKTVILCGGGTAGHITPALSVAKYLRQNAPHVRLIYVLERGSRFRHVVESSTDIDKILHVPAGKWRRYHGRSTMSKVFDIRILAQNIFGLVKTAVGVPIACWLLFRTKPSVIFAKGGFVGVPLGIAAQIFRVSLITHDSDQTPGLANRLISRWAILRTVASEETASAYHNERTVIVGIPVQEAFYPIDEMSRQRLRADLSVPSGDYVVVIVGGSQGAQSLNHAVREVVVRLKAELGAVYCLWAVGERNYQVEVEWLNTQTAEVQSSVRVEGYLQNVADWFQIADVVISRGGATFLAEILAAQKPSIIVPASFLPGDHQTENALHLAESGAILHVPEQEDQVQFAAELTHQTVKLLTDRSARERIQRSLENFAHKNAAYQIAQLIQEKVDVR